ncbi:MAG: hypothetical protein Q8K59_01360 [Nitrosomonas sp.]|nr:hypothetical protein [Nitrosomonas sp.]
MGDARCSTHYLAILPALLATVTKGLGPKQADALIAVDGNWHNPILVKEKK